MITTLTRRSTRPRYAERGHWRLVVRGLSRTRDEEAAIREFGTTDDTLQAGYILPDGTLLNFRRRMGGNFIVHSEIGKVLQHDRPAWRGGAIRNALDRGWVRVMSYGSRPTSFGVETVRPITPAQQQRIREAAERYDVDDVYIEVLPPSEGGLEPSWDTRAAPFALPKAFREANRAAVA